MNTYSEILARCLEDIEQGRATIEECVARFPQFAHLGQMLRVVAEARGVQRPTMSSADRDEIRRLALARLRTNTVLHNKTKQERLPIFSLWQRFVIIGSVVTIIILALGGSLVKASEAALPNDNLYVLKRIDEQIELSFAVGDSRVTVLNRIADTRLNEVDGLIRHNVALSDAIIADTSSCVLNALLLQTDASQRTLLYNHMVDVLARARTNDAISQDAVTRVLAIVAVTPLDNSVVQLPVASATPAPSISLTPRPENAFTATSSDTPITPTLTDTNTATQTEVTSTMVTETVFPAASVTQSETPTPAITETPAPTTIAPPKNSPSPTQHKGVGPTRIPTQKPPPANGGNGNNNGNNGGDGNNNGKGGGNGKK